MLSATATVLHTEFFHPVTPSSSNTEAEAEAETETETEAERYMEGGTVDVQFDVSAIGDCNSGRGKNPLSGSSKTDIFITKSGVASGPVYPLQFK